MKDEILIQAAELYNKYGIRSITMDDLARELGMSKKTLYEHFSDKEDLVRNSILYVQMLLQQQIKEVSSRHLNAIEELFEINTVINKHISHCNPSVTFDLKKYYPQISKQLLESKNRHIAQTFMANIQKGMDEGLYRSDLKVEIMTQLHLFRVENMSENNFLEMEKYTPAEIINEVLIYHIRGIASQKGIEFLEKII